MKPLNPLIYKASPKIGGGYLEKGGRRWAEVLSAASLRLPEGGWM